MTRSTKVDKFIARRGSWVIALLGIALCAFVGYQIEHNHQTSKTDSHQSNSLNAIFQQSPCLKAETDPRAKRLCQKTRDNFAATVTDMQSCSIILAAHPVVEIPGVGVFPLRCGSHIKPVSPLPQPVVGASTSGRSTSQPSPNNSENSGGRPTPPATPAVPTPPDTAEPVPPEPTTPKPLLTLPSICVPALDGLTNTICLL